MDYNKDLEERVDHLLNKMGFVPEDYENAQEFKKEVKSFLLSEIKLAEERGRKAVFADVANLDGTGLERIKKVIEGTTRKAAFTEAIEILRGYRGKRGMAFLMTIDEVIAELKKLIE